MSGTPAARLVRGCVGPPLAAAVLCLTAVACAPPGDSPEPDVVLTRDIRPSRDPAATEISAAGRAGAGYWLVDIDQSSADVRIHLLGPDQAWQSIDAPSRRAGPERACYYGNGAKFTFRVSNVVGTNDSTTTKVRVRFAPTAHDVAPFSLECAETRAALQHANWTSGLAAEQRDLYLSAAKGWSDRGDPERAAAATLQAAWLVFRRQKDNARVVALAETAANQLANRTDSEWLGHAHYLAGIARFDLATATEATSPQAVQQRDAIFAASARSLDAAESEFTRGNRQFWLAETANSRGSHAYYRGAYSQGAEALRQALQLYESASESEGALRAASNLAYVRYSMGHYRESVQAFDRAIALGADTATPEVLADILNNSAQAHSAAGNYETALEQLSRALATQRAAGDAAGEARSLQGIGTAYLRIGNARAAASFAAQAIAIRERTDRGTALIASMLLLGSAERSFAGPRRSLETHQRAVSLAVAPLDRAQAELARARDHAALGDWARADQDIAAAFRRLEPDWESLRWQLLLERGNSHLASARYAQAHDSFRAVVDDAGAASALHMQIDAWHGIAISAFRRGRLEEATTANRRTRDAIAAASNAVMNPEFRSRLVAARRRAYDLQVDLLAVALRRSRSAAERETLLQQSLHALDDARLPDGLQSSTAPQTAQDASDAWLRGEISLRESRLNGLAGSVTSTERQALTKELATLRVRFDLSDRVPASSGPRRAAQEIPDWRRVRADTAVVVYHVGDESRVWVLTNNGIESVPLSSRAELADAAAEMVRHLQSARTNAAGEMLRHSRVLLPVAIPRNKSRWIIVSNGVLADVPFAALSSSARHYMPVVASHEVIRATSVSSALALAASPDAPFAFSLGKVAVFFDPVFDESDARLASRESAKRVARFGQLPRLAGTAQEAQAIRAALERAEVVTFGGFEATRENALSSNALNASVLHFATHAIARDDWPHGAGLVMSGLGRDGTFRNGFLSTGDLRRRSIATPLVVLSACDTARGDMSSIDGVGGLAREFLASGASNVIASQWQIPDASTAALMRDFYTALRAGAPPSQALRQAQRLALADTRRRNPNHWGAMALYASAPRETQPGP